MSVKIHHLNCGIFQQAAYKNLIHRDYLCCHCLLLEGPDGLALIDTGLPTHYQNKLDQLYQEKFLNVREIETFNCVAQLKKLGFSSRDVRDIFITHLDHDHVGGLADFPEAKIHLHINEYEFSKKIENSIKLKLRFKSHLWQEANFEFYEEPGDKWNGFSSVKNSIAFEDELAIIPLFGHTPGHTGYAIKQKKEWIFHAGDAFYFKEDLNLSLGEQSLPGELIGNFTAVNNEDRLRNLRKLRELNAKTPEVTIINSHDSDYLPKKSQESKAAHGSK